MVESFRFAERQISLPPISTCTTSYDQIHRGNYLLLRIIIIIYRSETSSFTRHIFQHEMSKCRIRVRACVRVNVVSISRKNATARVRIDTISTPQKKTHDLEYIRDGQDRKTCEKYGHYAGTIRVIVRATRLGNANDPLKTEIAKRVAIGTESIPPSMID